MRETIGKDPSIGPHTYLCRAEKRILLSTRLSEGMTNRSIQNSTHAVM